MYGFYILSFIYSYSSFIISFLLHAFSYVCYFYYYVFKFFKVEYQVINLSAFYVPPSLPPLPPPPTFSSSIPSISSAPPSPSAPFSLSFLNRLCCFYNSFRFTIKFGQKSWRVLIHHFPHMCSLPQYQHLAPELYICCNQ